MAERNISIVFWLIVAVIAAVQIDSACGWRTFWKGRHFNGNLHLTHPNISELQLPPDQWYDQHLDNFNPWNNGKWKQVSSTATHFPTNF